MTTEEWELLLAALDPDPERAARRYEEIRKQLIRRFDHLGSTASEELADLTFDRFAHKLSKKGFELENEKPEGFLYGIAANVFREWRRKTITREIQIDQNPGPTSEDPPDLAGEEEAERRTKSLVQCLRQLPAEKRELVLAYYTGDDRIDARHRLATRLGLTPNALRIQAHRIRRQLEDCCKRRLSLRAVPNLHKP